MKPGDFVIEFGRHNGRTIDDVASTDDGLLYLDWLRGERAGRRTAFDQALNEYLDDPVIEKELKEMVSRG